MAAHAFPHHSLETLRRLGDVFGFDARHTQKIVLVVEAGEAVTVYVKKLVTRDQFAAVPGVFEVVPVADVTVTDQGDVEVTP